MPTKTRQFLILIFDPVLMQSTTEATKLLLKYVKMVVLKVHRYYKTLSALLTTSLQQHGYPSHCMNITTAVRPTVPRGNPRMAMGR